ncbi:hypothetical protein HNY73_020990 [Argiope bruennichi]|uniref:PiggyBac transposable element-derived protein domain-containing protein n=1 Tax=Argiope bruennichi TaxID=94029 RepID=A0A8T0E9Y8_ARGBR|nr:hypothetical protein HNY73_020990 [Argiope bruennichi]
MGNITTTNETSPQSQFHPLSLWGKGISESVTNELYADVLSDCPSDFEFSDDSDIRPSKQQRRILSDSEADSDEEWNDIDIVPSLEDYSRNSRVPNFECDPPSIVDVIDSFFDEEFFNLVCFFKQIYITPNERFA